MKPIVATMIIGAAVISAVLIGMYATEKEPVTVMVTPNITVVDVRIIKDGEFIPQNKPLDYLRAGWRSHVYSLPTLGGHDGDRR